MLKMTDIQLEIMTDIDLFQFIEKGMRGGILHISNRYGEANDKYMSMTPADHPGISCIWMEITFMVALCHNAYRQEDSNG